MRDNRIEIHPASVEEKPILRNLLELYQHDFSEYDQSDANRNGLFEYPYLDAYWTEPNRFPFLIRVEDILAGFVLVNCHSDPIYQESRWSVAEFFIMRKYRRRGIGSRVAVRIFEMFRGKWQVAQIENNLPAREFWRRVIREYTHGAYEEIPVNEDTFQGIILFFENSIPEEP